MDIEILAWLGAHRTDWADALFSFITKLGGELPIIAIACAVYWCVNRRSGNRLLFTLFSGILVNQFLKFAFCTPRPWLRSSRVIPVESALEEASGYSFPSGHTANAVSGYGGLAREKALKKYAWALWALVLLIGFSRCYLGVHTPQDVLVSLVLGVLIVFLMEKLERALDRRPKLDAPITAIMLFLSFLLAAFALFRPYPDAESAAYGVDALKLAGGAAGLFAGWLWERRRIGFSMPKSLLWGAARYAGGMAVVVLIMTGLKAPFIRLMGASVGGFIRYAIVGAFVTAVWPWAFTKAGF